MRLGNEYNPEEYYLGPNSWPRWVKKLLPYNRRFNYAAYLHDRFFSEGGDLEDLRRANNVFGTLVIANSNSSLSLSFARLYTLLVKAYGYEYFNFKSK